MFYVLPWVSFFPSSSMRLGEELYPSRVQTEQQRETVTRADSHTQRAYKTKEANLYVHYHPSAGTTCVCPSRKTRT